MSQEEISDILKRINELVIEAAHRGVPESKIMRSVYEGLDLVLGPPEEDDYEDWEGEDDEEQEDGIADEERGL